MKSIQQHPDAAAIRDWALYGPRDPKIALLVERLSSEHGMRLGEIEELMVGMLTAELSKRQDAPNR